MSLRWKSSFVERSIQINRPAIKRRSINSPLTSDVELEDMADFLPEIMVAKAKVNTKDSNFTHINDSITRKNDNMVGRSPDTKGRLWQNPFPTIENICKADHSVLHGNHASINSETASPISDNSVEVTNISLLQPDSHSTVPLIDVSDNNSKLDGLNNLKKVENSSEFISAVIPSEALEDPETQIESQEPVMLYERALRKISLAVADKIEALSKELGVVKKGGFRSVEEHSKLDLENGEPNNLSKSKVSEVQAVRKTNPPKKVLKKADSVVAVKPLFKILNGNPKAASQAVLLNDVTYHSRIIPTTESKGTKSKSLNELMRLSRASSVSSSSESDSFKEILANPDPVPGKNRPPYSHRKEENPQKVFVKKWTKKKFRRNPLTKLGMSKYDLLSITAGVFTGPGDIYHKFIFGGASIRENAIILKEKKIIEIDKGKMDKVIADASRAKTGVYHRVVETSREKLKVATCNSIDVKVAKLEELRA